MKRVLAFDLGTNCGVAYGETTANRPRSYTKVLKTGNQELWDAVANMAYLLRDFMWTEQFRPDLVVFEAAMMPFQSDPEKDERRVSRFRRSMESIILPWLLIGAIHAICALYQVKCQGVHMATIRKHFLGIARPPGGREEIKRRAVDRAIALGYMDEDDKRDDNRAEACGVWDYAVHVLCREQRPQFAMYEEGSRL